MHYERARPASFRDLGKSKGMLYNRLYLITDMPYEGVDCTCRQHAESPVTTLQALADDIWSAVNFSLAYASVCASVYS